MRSLVADNVSIASDLWASNLIISSFMVFSLSRITVGGAVHFFTLIPPALSCRASPSTTAAAVVRRLPLAVCPAKYSLLPSPTLGQPIFQRSLPTHCRLQHSVACFSSTPRRPTMEKPLQSRPEGLSECLTDRMERPSLDDRTYRVIRLSNKLEALLIHDPETDKASAALDVNAGSLSDDEDLPGMAHAVEHLLFMGTEKVSVPVTFPPNK